MKNQRGFIALISVLTLSALGLLVGTGLVLRAVDRGNAEIMIEAAWRAQAAATHCVEEAALRIQLDKNYAGHELLSVSEDTCYILPVSKQGNTYQVLTTSTVMGATRKMSVEIKRQKKGSNINSWQEVADF